MKKIYRKKTIWLIAGLMSIISCNQDFLDVSHELADEKSMESIFSNPTDMRKFHRSMYWGIPNSMSFIWWSVFTTYGGQTNVWAMLSDDMCKNPPVFPYERPLTPTDQIITRWSYYQLIRQANLFLQHAKEIPRKGSADYIGPEELADLKAQARFMRAYYHYLLFEIYGPVPIMDFVSDPSNPNLDYARNSVDEVVSFIYDELTEVSKELRDPDLNNPELLALPTKGTALAVRARLMIYAASPLFNGGYEEGLKLTNKDGKKLFPEADPSKWNKALDAIQEFIDYANAGHYELHKEYTNGVLDPHKSIYEVHMKYNKEIILARSEDNTTSPSNRIDKRNIPRGARGSATNSGGVAATQELVDAFFMVDGLSIDESPLYSEEGFSKAGEDLSGQTTVGTYRMFINREPRFYQTIFYNGRRWHVGNEQIWFNMGGNSDRTKSVRWVRTGHLMYKRMSRRVYDQGSHPREEYRPPIVHRLAEFYLLYAEALNEVNPSDSRIIEYVDKVRERAGIPLLAKIKPEIIGDQKLQREAIRAEMRVELCTEGQRYHDLRRWMIAYDGEPGKGKLNGPFYGMDMSAPTLDGFYKRTVIHNRVFSRAEYLMPIPQNEILKSKLLVQNPGY